MHWIIIFILTAIPVFIIMKLITSFDQVDKEPLKMLILLFIGGILSWIVVKFTSNLLNGRVYELQAGSPFLKNDWEFFLISFGLIAVVEELSKFLLLNIFCWRSKEFDYPYDGIVYAVFVSLGFAFTENLFYLDQYGLGIALSRALFSIPAHACFGVQMGYYIGLGKSCYKKNMPADGLKMRYLAFFVPLILHGLYDYICNFNSGKIYYVFIGYVLLMFGLAALQIKKTYQLEYDIYQKKGYDSDDIIGEDVISNDNSIDQVSNIREKLFNEQDQATWQLDNNQNNQQQNNVFNSNRFHMDMFADKDDDDEPDQ